MGTFRRTIEVANIGRRSRAAEVLNVLVDTGSEYTWIPAGTLEGIGIKREKKDLAFLMANGQTVTRSTGFAIVRIGEAFTVDEVVFGEPGDQALLGARTLEGYEPDRRSCPATAGGGWPAACRLVVRRSVRAALNQASVSRASAAGDPELDFVPAPRAIIRPVP